MPEKVEVRAPDARVERTRNFGDVCLRLLLWRTLRLDWVLAQRMSPHREDSYLLRTDLLGWTPPDLCRSHIQLTQAGSAFRTEKSEFRLRLI